jgi:hypothetical protein
MKALLQKLNSRSLLNIGLFVFILLLVLLVTYEPGTETEKKPVLLTELKQADIEFIELKRAHEKNIKLEKREGVWYITEPYQLPANDFRAQSVVALSETKSHLQYDANTIELKKFKLDKPEISIILNKQVTLEVGGVDPIKNRRYVKNGDTLHLVSDTFYYQLIGKVTAYVSYQLLSPSIKLNKLVLPKFTLTLQAGDWQISPEQKDTSADSVNEFINEWRHAQSLEISEYTGRLRKANIQIFMENQEKPIQFRLQRKNNNTYLIRNDLRLRYKLSDETTEKLQKLPDPPEPEEQPVATEQPGSDDKPAN